MAVSRAVDATCAGLVMTMLSVGVALSGACIQTKRSLGEDCLKNDDCLSGICSQLKCAAEPQLLDAEVGADVTEDAPLDAGPDGAGVVTDAAGDAGTGG
jgi:hypothetical protein